MRACVSQRLGVAYGTYQQHNQITWTLGVCLCRSKNFRESVCLSGRVQLRKRITLLRILKRKKSIFLSCIIFLNSPILSFHIRELIHLFTFYYLNATKKHLMSFRGAIINLRYRNSNCPNRKENGKVFLENSCAINFSNESIIFMRSKYYFLSRNLYRFILVIFFETVSRNLIQ